jgi:DNA-binding transcriptional MerR regulator
MDAHKQHAFAVSGSMRHCYLTPKTVYNQIEVTLKGGSFMSEQLLIGELARRGGVRAKTVRYYEDLGILPPAERLPNGYRVYRPEDVDRLRFVRGARSLGLTLDDIGEVLAFRDRGEAPCRYVVDLLHAKIEEVGARIIELQRLQESLQDLSKAAQRLPQDDIEMKHCVCHLVQGRADTFPDKGVVLNRKLL